MIHKKNPTAATVGNTQKTKETMTTQTQTLQQPAGDIVTLKLSNGAVFGVFKQGRRRYLVASLTPRVSLDWLPCEFEPIPSKRQALEFLNQHLATWGAMCVRGDF